MLDYAAAKKVATVLAALAEPTRIRVFHQLAAGPQNVGALAELVGVPIVNMSHHLGVMRQAGVLTDEKDGRRVIYRLNPDVCAAGDAADTLAVLDLGSGYVVKVRKGVPGEKPAKPAKKA